MTALNKDERLECIGLWLSNPAAQRREVILSFGKATLVLTDTQNRALSHWSLAAVEIQKGKSGQATLRPGFDAEESIEIDDRTMLEALLKVKKEISQSAPHPGKLRLILAIALITILSILSLFLGPQAITSYAGKILQILNNFNCRKRLSNALVNWLVHTVKHQKVRAQPKN